MAAGREDFEAFVAARYAALLRTAYLLTGDHHDAEDLLQQSLVKAVGAWKRIDGDPEPYVRTILVRQNVSRWRSRRWRELTTELPPEILASTRTPTPASRCTGRSASSRHVSGR